jgi:hypothetical protein
LGARLAFAGRMSSSLSARRALGLWGGRLLAPITATVSSWRRGRMFHPEGVIYRAQVTAVAGGELQELGERLAGHALLRFSSAWWRGKDWPDVLGAALRFRDGPLADVSVQPGDQDLLLATIRFPWTTPFAPLTTRFGSFLWNHYHAVSPFEVPGVGQAKLRLRAPRIPNHSGTPRAAHLESCVASGQALFVLELRRLATPWSRRRWQPVALVRVEAAVDMDQEALRFSPFHSGRELKPSGFVHHLRMAAYEASQQARPARAG